ncbi:pectate lyase A [Colletotrichum godetiae]|uniref:Pectate lyase n=1 Tax=Colletotrichum godetiae TaxID=1209918 RepID=A0AAJ0A693_9PEZI|nr:pectate lyase A [Colletotrichum godetiae]KAK1657267.1 pectate lyase A [Colletotrichum godetiae]
MFIFQIMSAAVLASLVAGQTLNIPSRSGSIISLTAPSVISGSRDFGNKEYDRGRSCNTDVETSGGHPVFVLENGAAISNVIIGAGQVRACTLKNVWFRQACEGGVRGGAGNRISHLGRGTATVKDFTAANVNRLYRSCTNPANNGGPINLAVTNLKANNVKLLTGINSNFGDIATVCGSCGASITEVCQEYKGVEKGQESPKAATTTHYKGQTILDVC